MTFDFSNLFTGDTIKIDGYKHKIGFTNNRSLYVDSKYEDDEFLVQFLSDGSIRVTTKLYPGDPQRTYIKNNALMDEWFGNYMKPKQVLIEDGIGYSAVVNHTSVIKDENGEKMNHSVYIENILYVYNDGYGSTEGIFFYVVDTPVEPAKKKK